jgi:hypothetical protein
MKTLDIQLTNVDNLGLLLAQVADLNEQVEALKDALKNQGEGKYAGNLYNATITLSQRNTIDYKKICEDHKIQLSAEQIAAYTKTTASITCKVTSR